MFSESSMNYLLRDVKHMSPKKFQTVTKYYKKVTFLSFASTNSSEFFLTCDSFMD